MIIYNVSVCNVYYFWHISSDHDKIMTGLLLHDGAGPVVYMWLPGQRRALRVSAAENWLTVYRRRIILRVKIRLLVQPYYVIGLCRRQENFRVIFYNRAQIKREISSTNM